MAVKLKLPFKYNIADGVPVPPFLDQQRLDKLKKFPLRPDDVFIVTYPKSGTNWTRQIVRLVLNNGEDDGREFLGSRSVILWLAVIGRRGPSTETMPSPRAFFAHMSYDTMHGGPPNTSPARYIYIARNPKDVLVSYYYFFISGSNFKFSGHWDDLFEVFMNGKLYFGSWFDHVLGWWKHKDDPNVLFLKYEDMKKDLLGAVRAISEFIGVELKPDIIEKIAEQSTIDSMKAIDFSNLRRQFAVDLVNPFVRKGVVGEWKSHFTAEQAARFDALYEQKMRGTGLEFEFEKPVVSRL